jgi:hypothetical protein
MSVPVWAEEEQAESAEEAAETRPIRIIDRVKEALGLPQTAREAREAGASEDKIREVLETARSRGVPADETRRILETENEELRKGGNPDDFGAAVHRLKESGLRGRELAEAIHAEQIARGMKKPTKLKHGEKIKGKGRVKAKHHGERPGEILTEREQAPLKEEEAERPARKGARRTRGKQ